MFHVQISEAEITSKPALLSSSASVTFFFRPSVSFCSLSCLSVSLTGCPSSCMSLPSQPLGTCLISATMYTPWAVLPYLPDRPLDYINRIFRCRRQLLLAVVWPPLRVWPSTLLV